MSELAFNLAGESFEVPSAAVGWRVRRLKPKGAPEVVYGRDGIPLILPIEAEMEDLRHEARLEGRYRLDPLDDQNRMIPNAPAGYVYLHPVEHVAEPTPPPAPVPQGPDHAVIEAMRMNTELARTIIERFPAMLDSAAGLLRAADGAGMPARAPQVLPEPTEEDDEPEIEETVEVAAKPTGWAGLLETLIPLVAPAILARRARAEASDHRVARRVDSFVATTRRRGNSGRRSQGGGMSAVQRLRIPAPDPNCVERASLYLGVAELIDPWPIRQLATLDFDWGRHTFPIESGAPIVLDPRVTSEDLQRAVTPVAPAVSAALAPVAIEVTEAVEYTVQLAETGAAAVRNGPGRARLARNAIRSLVETGTPPTDARTIDAMGWFFAQAEQVARGYGDRALAIVRTTAQAIADLVDDILARQQHNQQRNLSFEFGGTSYGIPSWLSGLGSLVGRIGLDVGAVALRPKLAAMGITGELLQLVEEELNADGLSLGPLARPGKTMTSALGSINSKRAT